MKKRHGVLLLLVALAVITFLDRIAIAVAGPRIQRELDISPERWGWILGAFVRKICRCGLPFAVEHPKNPLVKSMS